MKVFQKCLREQLYAHPSMQPQDVVKLCYQAACGAEHLLSDLDGAKFFFEEEYAAVSMTNEPLYEQISEYVCRVNLGAWKQAGLPSEQLFQLFADTVFDVDGKESLARYLSAAEEVLQEADFDMTAWQTYIAACRGEGMPSVRHSERYREAERPAYRIVSMQMLKTV
ncbi:MAG: hypothetical protein IJD81_06175 [Oscillospiraceae bacterium]|nr:hypothetical protein [Oscillospiraceae bacterium]